VLERFVPMVHVPDVRATAGWYTSIGFRLICTNEEDGEMDWALLSLGNSDLMLSAGGKASTAQRREMDLYVHTDNLETRYAALKTRVQVIQDLYETFYGMREFIIRDVNRF
jgi:uncharacterized glyoxalase superfamily protein PhnB